MIFDPTAFIVGLFFPRRCLICKSIPGDDSAYDVICPACRGEVKISHALFCGACHARLFVGRVACHPDFPYLLGAATSYEDPKLRVLVHALKFRGVRRAAEPLAAFVIEYASLLDVLLENFVVLPIPLSAERRRIRGFNQAELIAEPLAKARCLPLNTTSLIRARHTKPQSEITNVTLRQENMRGVFRVSAPSLISGKNILLVDDVTTTGATFFEAASALKTAGARRIIALAAAKA